MVDACSRDRGYLDLLTTYWRSAFSESEKPEFKPRKVVKTAAASFDFAPQAARKQPSSAHPLTVSEV